MIYDFRGQPLNPTDTPKNQMIAGEPGILLAGYVPTVVVEGQTAVAYVA